MATIQDVFGSDLQPDPAIQLPPLQVPVRSRSGPLPRLQYVIELVGPRSVAGSAVSALLTPAWQEPLGRPQVFGMAASDVEWQPLGPGVAAPSYDSVALAWDLEGPQGRLNTASAQHLLTTAEHFASQIQRRAMPMPVPEDVPKAIALLDQARANLDAGVSLLVLANSQEVSEFEAWVWCAKLGLQPNLAEGTFDWIVPSSPLPVFSVSPVGDTESFTLEGAQRGDKHEGLLLGFSLPRSPEPMGGLESMFRAADVLASKMWGQVYDESNAPITSASRQAMRQQLAEGIGALERLGFPPGSPQALQLFPAV